LLLLLPAAAWAQGPPDQRSGARGGRTSPARPTPRQTFRPIRGRPWRGWPTGFSYRRWRTGQTLPRVFITNDFFFNDWTLAGLPPPGPGRAWVRQGPDLLLVRRSSGRIERVLFNVFI